jgi:hypothetical protein
VERRTLGVSRATRQVKEVMLRPCGVAVHERMHRICFEVEVSESIVRST